MTFKISVILFLFLLQSTNIFSQNFDNSNKDNKILELKTKLLTSDSYSEDTKINTSVAQSKKSPALALLFSLIIPGSGHLYLDRMDVGKYFFGTDVAAWMGYATLNFYGNDVIDDAKTFSNQHAAVQDIDNKDDDYFANVGNYANIYEYNNYQLTIGGYSALYDVNQYYWDWDNTNNQNIFETQRKNSERIYNSRIIFGSILIANRIVAGISAYLIASKDPKKSSSLNIEPELLYKKDLSFDGVKINLTRNF